MMKQGSILFPHRLRTSRTAFEGVLYDLRSLKIFDNSWNKARLLLQVLQTIFIVVISDDKTWFLRRVSGRWRQFSISYAFISP